MRQIDIPLLLTNKDYDKKYEKGRKSIMDDGTGCGFVSE